VSCAFRFCFNLLYIEFCGLIEPQCVSNIFTNTPRIDVPFAYSKDKFCGKNVNKSLNHSCILKPYIPPTKAFLFYWNQILKSNSECIITIVLLNAIR
jgi:hypothetical protein